MQLPFEFVNVGILTNEERQAIGRAAGQAFLDLLADTAPGHRSDYGGILKVVFTGLEEIPEGFRYSGYVEIERSEA